VDEWSDLERAAAAMRRLNRAVARFDASDADLDEVARVAAELAQRLEAQPARYKKMVFPAVPIDAGGAAERVRSDGGHETTGDLEFDPFSVGGGRLSPASVGLQLRRDGAAAVAARCVVDGMFQGPPGRVHGGVVALIFDELMAMVVRLTGRRAFTVRLQVHLRAPAPIDAELSFRAWQHEIDGRKIVIHAEGHSADGLFAEADALFIQVPH
jgi:acyl-coenzyme A thioesterase PaaI-like protein